MKTVYKYPIDLLKPETGVLTLPRGARCVLAAPPPQELERRLRPGEVLCLWFEVETRHQVEVRHFKVFGTGHEQTTTEGQMLEHVASVVVEPFVWHVYESKPIPDPTAIHYD